MFKVEGKKLKGAGVLIPDKPAWMQACLMDLSVAGKIQALIVVFS